MLHVFSIHPAIPGGGLGTLAGALLVYCTKSKGKKLSLIPWIVAFVALLPTLGFLFSCPNKKIAGIHETVGNRYVNRSCQFLFSAQVIPRVHKEGREYLLP